MKMLKVNLSSDLSSLAWITPSLTLIFTIFQFNKNASREKKEATLLAYNELQKDVFSYLTKFALPMPLFNREDDEWIEITKCLAKLEHFSTAINTGIYSIKILDRLGGDYYIRQFEKLKPIIDKKRKENIARGNHYTEFEATVEKLKRMKKYKSLLTFNQ